MSRTYRFPDEIPLNRRAVSYFDRADALQRALTAASVTSVSNHARSELWSLVSERGCPPAKAVAIVTGASVWRPSGPRLVA